MKYQTENPYLLVHEWLALAVILGSLALLTLTSFRSTSYEVDHDHPYLISDPYMEVSLEGAFKQPGRVRVKKGSTLGEILQQHPLLPEANLKKMNLNAKIRPGKLIKIPFQEMITIHLKGAVEATTITIPKGSQLQDLIGKIPFSENVDLEKLKKKRRLKDGETILIKKTKTTKGTKQF